MKASEFYGGSVTISISADIRISRHQAWVWVITADVGSLAVQLPDATKLIPGYPVIQVVNDGATAFAIEDHGGATLIASVAQNDVYTFGLVENDDADGLWAWGQWTQLGGAGPPALNNPWTIGGGDGGMINEAWQYDFVADSWSQLGGSIAEGYDGVTVSRIGTNGIGICLDEATEAKTFDPNTWADVTDGSYNRSDAAGAQEEPGDDRAYFYGAFRTSGNTIEADYYDISGDAWTDATNMLRSRHKGWTGSDGDTLHYVMGGATSTFTNHAGVVNNDQYDIPGDAWTALTDMNQQRLQHTGAINKFNDDQWVYAGRTASNGSLLDTVESYSISGDSWTVRSNHPNGTHSRGGGSQVDENLNSYTFGGENATNPDATYKHNPRSDSYTALTDHGAATANCRNFGIAILSD